MGWKSLVVGLPCMSCTVMSFAARGRIYFTLDGSPLFDILYFAYRMALSHDKTFCDTSQTPVGIYVLLLVVHLIVIASM